MTYTVLIKLTNYRTWTESLGYDREWIIQTTQSRIYHDLQLLSKEFKGFTLPMRYDIQIVLLPSNTSLDGF
ncbi:MAG: GTP cyclohydrolase IIa, partial [Sulfolobales archaeon]